MMWRQHILSVSFWSFILFQDVDSKSFIAYDITVDNVSIKNCKNANVY